MAKIEHGLVLAQRYKTLLEREGINTPRRKAHFFGQAYAESKFELVREDLRYSAVTLLRVFRKYFTPAMAIKYAYKAEAIANIAYANRMGNGDTASGEGWKYRGFLWFQLTGKLNFKAVSKATGVDYVTDPDKHMTEADAITTAIWYWNTTGLSRYADANDIDAVSDLINIGRRTKLVGDANGYKHRKEYTEYFLKKF